MTPFFKYASGLCAAILLAAAFVVVAHADTVTLGPVGCGIVKQCVSIPNDAGLDVSLYGAPGYPFFYLYVDGVQYRSQQPSGTGLTAGILTDGTGDVIYLTYAFSTYQTCTRSGRGQHCSTHWQFTGGSLIR